MLVGFFKSEVSLTNWSMEKEINKGRLRGLFYVVGG